MPEKGRVLAIDWGSKRIGLALSDPTRFLASPFDTVPANPRSKFIALVAEIVEKEKVTTIIVGLPFNMDGSEGKSALEARELGEELKKLNIPVEFFDERLSSYSAEQILIANNRKPFKNKGLIDKTAAAVLLQSYLDENR